MTKEEVYDNLREENGINGQLMVAVEELAELTKEITKLSRRKGSTMRLTEEIADVQICIEQLQRFFNIENSSIKVFKDFKIKRLEEFYVKEAPKSYTLNMKNGSQLEFEVSPVNEGFKGCTFDE